MMVQHTHRDPSTVVSRAKNAVSAAPIPNSQQSSQRRESRAKSTSTAVPPRAQGSKKSESRRSILSAGMKEKGLIFIFTFLDEVL